MSKKFNIVFMGTPPFAAQILESLIKWDGCKIIASYCQPDRPTGRGKKLVAPAVKIVSQENDIPVFQPLNFSDDKDHDVLKNLKPDFLIVAAYGLILPQKILSIPTFAPINIHASLLPFYRGAAPIQRAIMDEQKFTGVSIMKMEKGLDTGPVYRKDVISIGEHTSESLHQALAILGASSLIKVLEIFSKEGRAEAVEQEHSKATYAAKLKKEEGFINWKQSASKIHAQICGVTFWPAAQARILRDENIFFDVIIGPGCIGPRVVIEDEKLENAKSDVLTGTIYRLKDGKIAVSTLDFWYILSTIKPKSKKEMSAQAFANGYLSKGYGPLAVMQGK